MYLLRGQTDEQSTRVGDDVVAEDKDPTNRRPDEPSHRSDQGGLPGTVGSQQAEEAAPTAMGRVTRRASVRGLPERSG